jgi:hypothetical protein
MTDETDTGGRRKSPPKYARPEDFVSILPEGKYMFTPTRQMWDSTTVNNILGKGAAKDMDKRRACAMLTWAPGLPMVIENKVILDGEWRDTPGHNTFNLYLPPAPLTDGEAWLAEPWLELGFKLFGDDLEHLLDWCAYRVQHPGTKINHSLVLGSFDQGIGKDSWLAALQRAVGRRNWRNVSAKKALKEGGDGNNSFLESVILQVSEAHEMGNARFGFYETTKDWAASPPFTLMSQDKWVKQHPILNLVGVVYTTNHKSDGLHIPREDRRHFVAWSEREQKDFAEEYWRDFYWPWLETGGDEHVAAYLMTRDVTKWNPKASPPKTAAWHEIVAAGTEPQDADLADLLDKLGDDYIFSGTPSPPDAVTLDQLKHHDDLTPELADIFKDKNRRVANHRLEAAGYVPVSNPDNQKGLWRVNGKRQVIYANRKLAPAEQRAAVKRLIGFETAMASHPLTDAEQAARDFDQ